MAMSERHSLALQRLPVEPEAPAGAIPKSPSLARPGYWEPPGMRLTPRRGDVYVVVDDLVQEEEHRVAILAIRLWPTVDDLGRLTFLETASRRMSVDPDYLQERINAARSKDRRLTPEVRTRPLRIGDAFLARGLGGRSRPSWAALEDVTPSARDQAKVALFAAVALPVTRSEVDRLRLTDVPETASRTTSPTAARPSI
jgi:hypothetical protein